MEAPRVNGSMPEYCPHCNVPIDSSRREPEEGRPYEVWRCEECDEEWRHPEETILSRNLDFSKNKEQLSRQESDADLSW